MILFGLIGLVIPVVHLRLIDKDEKKLRRYAPVLSMGACCLAIWRYSQWAAHHDWSWLEPTYRATNGIALALVVVTLLLNLFLAWAESRLDKEEASQ